MAYKQIGDYGVIGDGNTVALILGPAVRVRRPALYRCAASSALLAGRAVQNEPNGTDVGAGAQPGAAMKRAMNAVRAEFYDGQSQGIDYATIRGATAYRGDGVFLPVRYRTNNPNYHAPE